MTFATPSDVDVVECCAFATMFDRSCEREFQKIAPTHSIPNDVERTNIVLYIYRFISRLGMVRKKKRKEKKRKESSMISSGRMTELLKSDLEHLQSYRQVVSIIQ